MASGISSSSYTDPFASESDNEETEKNEACVDSEDEQCDADSSSSHTSD